MDVRLAAGAVSAALALSALLGLVLIWKLGRGLAVIGAIGVAIVSALATAPLHAACGTPACTLAASAGQIGLALGLGLAVVLLRFWRDPPRTSPVEAGIVTSPADGRVCYVRTVQNDSIPLVRKSGRDYALSELAGTRLLAGPAVLVGVEMNLLDVHVTRCPLPGRITAQQRVPGGFMSLRRDEAPFVNARLTTVVENPRCFAAVVQVASRLVRRVDAYLAVGDAASLGQRLGMIRFGSLVVLVLPVRDDVRIVVEPGDRVTAGVTVLARYHAGPDSAEKGES